VAKPLKDIPKTKASFWKKLGDEVADRIQVHTKKGKDVNGANFKKYKTHNPFWFSKKIGGKTIRIYAEDYPTRKDRGDFKRQTSFSKKPDLTLTGDMLRNLQTRSVTNESVIIGWSGTNAEKVKWNEDMGRTVTTERKPVAKSIERFIDKQINATIDRNIKATNETKTFVIG
jgi:hypothetical protein|tara:strand:- start:472 stop:987 length:516 start_codon:yes stop_codon:yes gene_type:complete